MAADDFSLAHVQQAKAYQVGEFVLLRIAGDLPTPCHVVDIERSLLTVEPPAFIARWTLPPNIRCIQVVTPYEYEDAFRIGAARPEIRLHHADGDQLVPVEDLTPAVGQAPERYPSAPGVTPATPTDDATGMEAVDVLQDVLGGPAEAVGFSRAFDFGEALRDAIEKLPSRGGSIPDWLSRYEVVSSGAEIGGIAGFNHLYVRVRG